LGRRPGFIVRQTIQGRIADRTLQNQEHRASGLNLVIAAIALWNTLRKQRAVEHLQDREVAAPDELLAHLSPLSWAHIGSPGDYLWADAATARSRLSTIPPTCSTAPHSPDSWFVLQCVF
jgi:hypothetical protein